MLLKVPLYARNGSFEKYVTASLHPADFFWVPRGRIPADPNAVVDMGDVSYEINCPGKLKSGFFGPLKGRDGHSFSADIRFDLSELGSQTKRNLSCTQCNFRIPYKAYMEGRVGSHILRFDAWTWGGAGFSKKKVRANVIYPASTGTPQPTLESS
jgi:hypothetical protein